MEKNSLKSQSPSRGGGKQRIVSQAFSEFYTRRFIFEYWQVKEISRLTPEKRQIAVHVLYEHFGFTPLQLSHIFHRNKSTIYRDIEAAAFYCNKTKYARRQVKKLVDFIKNHYSSYLSRSGN